MVLLNVADILSLLTVSDILSLLKSHMEYEFHTGWEYIYIDSPLNTIKSYICR